MRPRPSWHRSTPSRDCGIWSRHHCRPSRHCAAPSRHCAAPSWHCAAPARHCATPSRHCAAPSRHIGHTGTVLSMVFLHLNVPHCGAAPGFALSRDGMVHRHGIFVQITAVCCTTIIAPFYTVNQQGCSTVVLPSTNRAVPPSCYRPTQSRYTVTGPCNTATVPCYSITVLWKL